MRMKKILSFLLTFAMVVSLLPAAAFAAENTATTMRLAKTQGTVSVTNGTGKAVTQTTNMKLYNGYQLKTGAKSYAWVSLDDTKVAKLDANSAVEVQKSGQKLTLYLSSGNIFFNVKDPLKSGESFHIKTSTMTTGIRGTSGCVRVVSDRVSEIHLLTGQVEVYTENPLMGVSATAILRAGQKAFSMIADEAMAATGEQADIIIERLDGSEVCGNCAKEIEADEALRERIKKEAPHLLPDVIAETADERLAADEAEAEAKQAEIDEAVARQEFPEDVDPYFEETSSGGGGGGGGSSSGGSGGATDSDTNTVREVADWGGLYTAIDDYNKGEDIDEIELTQNISGTGSDDPLPAISDNGPLTLNLKDFTLSLNDPLVNNGNLTITNNLGFLTADVDEFLFSNPFLIDNKGTLTQKKGTLSLPKDFGNCVAVYNDGIYNMEGGAIENGEGEGASAVWNWGTFNMSGGTIDFAGGGTAIENYATINLSGSAEINISGQYGYAIDNKGTGTVNMTGGTINVDLEATGIRNGSDEEYDENGDPFTILGTVNIDGANAKIVGKNGYLPEDDIVPYFATLIWNDGAFELANGTLSVGDYGYGVITGGDDCITRMVGGTVEAAGADSTGFILGSGTNNFSGGTVKATGADAVGMSVQAEVSFTGTEVIAESTSMQQPTGVWIWGGEMKFFGGSVTAEATEINGERYYATAVQCEMEDYLAQAEIQTIIRAKAKDTVCPTWDYSGELAKELIAPTGYDIIPPTTDDGYFVLKIKESVETVDTEGFIQTLHNFDGSKKVTAELTENTIISQANIAAALGTSSNVLTVDATGNMPLYIDLAGNDLIITNANIVNSANLFIIDSVGGGQIYGQSNPLFSNTSTGSMTLQGGKLLINNTTAGTASSADAITNDGGTINLDGMTVEVGGTYKYAFYNESNSTFSMTAGELKVATAEKNKACRGLWSASDCEINISGGTVTMDGVYWGQSAFGVNNSYVTISGDVVFNVHAGYIVDEGNVTMSGGEINLLSTDNHAFGFQGSTVEMTGGTINVDIADSVTDWNTVKLTTAFEMGDVYMKGGTINVNNGYGFYKCDSVEIGDFALIKINAPDSDLEGAVAVGALVGSDNELHFYDGEIRPFGAGSVGVLTEENGYAQIYGGEFTVTNGTAIENHGETYFAGTIYANNDTAFGTGVVTYGHFGMSGGSITASRNTALDVKDGTIALIGGTITATATGITAVKMADGAAFAEDNPIDATIKAKENGLVINPMSKIPDGYEVVQKDSYWVLNPIDDGAGDGGGGSGDGSETTETVPVDNSGDFLAALLDFDGSEATKIELNTNDGITDEILEAYGVPENMVKVKSDGGTNLLVIDLKGHTLEISATTLVNQGNLKIIDSVGGGKITGHAADLIQNNNILELNGGTMDISASDAYRAVVNVGTMTMSGGEIRAQDGDEAAISVPTGKLTMTGGTIYVSDVDTTDGCAAGIYTYNHQKLLLEGGSIIVEDTNGFGISFGGTGTLTLADDAVVKGKDANRLLTNMDGFTTEDLGDGYFRLVVDSGSGDGDGKGDGDGTDSSVPVEVGNWTEFVETVNFFNQETEPKIIELTEDIIPTDYEKANVVLAPIGDGGTNTSTLTIDVGEHKLNLVNEITVAETGSLKVEGTTGAIIRDYSGVITNNGTFELAGGELDGYTNSIVRNNDEMIMTGGTITVDEEIYAIMNQGTVTMTGGVINLNNTYSNGIWSGDEINFGGTAEIHVNAANSYGIYGDKTTTVTDGKIYVNVVGAVGIGGYGTLNMSGGEIKIKESDAEKASYGIKGLRTINLSGDALIHESDLLEDVTDNLNCGIYLENTNGELNLKDGVVTMRHGTAISVPSVSNLTLDDAVVTGQDAEKLLVTEDEDETGFDVTGPVGGYYTLAIADDGPSQEEMAEALYIFAELLTVYNAGGGVQEIALTNDVPFDNAVLMSIDHFADKLAEMGFDEFMIFGGEALTIDLKGHDLILKSTLYILNYSQVTITDSVGGGKITGTAMPEMIILMDGASLTLDDVEMEVTEEDQMGIKNTSTGELVVTSDTTITVKGKNALGIDNQSMTAVVPDGCIIVEGEGATAIVPEV